MKLILSYDGTHFFGWQKTRMGPSIEEELTRILEQVLCHKIALDAASRTDRGVHAIGQVACFRTDREMEPRRLLRALSGLLPKTISVRACEWVDLDFHPTLDAVEKEYHYFLCLGSVQLPMYRLYSWHLHRPLAVDVMESAAKQFLGTHDFSSFANLRAKQPICTLKSVECVREEGRLRIALRADRFLYKMARNLVGTLVAIGRGHLDGKSISELLSSQKRTRIGMTAPARGLFLSEVIYTPST